MARCCHRNLLIISGSHWKPISLSTIVTCKAPGNGLEQEHQSRIAPILPEGAEDEKAAQAEAKKWIEGN